MKAVEAVPRSPVGASPHAFDRNRSPAPFRSSQRLHDVKFWRGYNGASVRRQVKPNVTELGELVRFGDLAKANRIIWPTSWPNDEKRKLLNLFVLRCSANHLAKFGGVWSCTRNVQGGVV